MITSAPAAVSVRLIASPIPEEAPVTSILFPEKSNLIIVDLLKTVR
jgi:hypothetical protein